MRLIALICALILPHAVNSAASAGGKNLGVPTAPVMIEVYSDFQCPACKTLHEQTLRPLVLDYVRTGKVYLVHREFPLTGHAYSRQTAYLACAAERIGKYMQVADAIFASQAVWSVNGKVEEAVLRVLTPAEAAKLRALTKDPGVVAEVERDLQLGGKIPIQQTPTMIITHRLRQLPLTGSVNYALLRRYIDGLLAN
jgi:protein-disulfide isomerase